jgi:hypothetical protein
MYDSVIIMFEGDSVRPAGNHDALDDLTNAQANKIGCINRNFKSRN